MATSLTPARVEQLKRTAKRMSREHSIPLHEAQQQLAEASGYKNWSLLQKHALPEDAPKPMMTPPAHILGSRDRYYLHGDQHADQPSRFYCRSCDEFVEARHFYAEHDQRETLKRALDAINRWATREIEQLVRRPLGALNMLEAPARAQAAAYEASRSSFHRWLERQKGRNSPTGHIARNILRDNEFPVTANTHEAVENYLHSQFASDAAVKALKGAWRSFQASQKRTKAPAAAEAASERWLAENREALESSNRFAEQGLPLGRHRNA